MQIGADKEISFGIYKNVIECISVCYPPDRPRTNNKKTQTKYIYNIKSLNINFGYLFCMLRKFKNRTQNRA